MSNWNERYATDVVKSREFSDFFANSSRKSDEELEAIEAGIDPEDYRYARERGVGHYECLAIHSQHHNVRDWANRRYMGD